MDSFLKEYAVIIFHIALDQIQRPISRLLSVVTHTFFLLFSSSSPLQAYDVVPKYALT